MSNITEGAIEQVADAAELVSEESAQFAEATRGLSSREVGLIFSGLGVGVAIGFAGGYFFLRNKLQTKYEQLADEEISDMREHYNQKLVALNAQTEKKTLDEVVEDLDYASRGEGGKVPYHKVSENTEVNGMVPSEVVEDEAKNVFDLPQPEVEENWDYQAEVKSRSSDTPYVIHRDEYTENELEHDQHTFTYFEGDDVLCDERDNVIEDQDGVVGLGSLSRFGHGSGDPNIVYVRNEDLKVDIEVVHSDGKYATEVHGFQDDELQHSSMRRRLPRRSDYDNSD